MFITAGAIEAAGESHGGVVDGRHLRREHGLNLVAWHKVWKIAALVRYWDDERTTLWQSSLMDQVLNTDNDRSIRGPHRPASRRARWPPTDRRGPGHRAEWQRSSRLGAAYVDDLEVRLEQ